MTNLNKDKDHSLNLQESKLKMPWSEEDIEAVTKLLYAPYQDQRDAVTILSLLNERGLLREKIKCPKCEGRKVIFWERPGGRPTSYPCECQNVSLSDLKERYPDLVSQIQAEERERCAKVAEDAYEKAKYSESITRNPSAQHGFYNQRMMAQDITTKIRSLPQTKEEA